MEILIVVALLTMLGGLGLVGMKSGPDRARGSDALAQVVAERFRQVRAKAMSSAVPTALVFPSENGGKPHTQACLIVSGEERGQVVKTYDFSGDFPQSCLFVGTTGAAGETLKRPQLGEKLQGFSAQDWYPGRDYQFIFTPSGQVLTNDLPLLDGHYFVVVAGGLAYTNGTAPGDAASVPVTPAPNYFQLTSASLPYTISIAANSGKVEVKPGLTGVVASDPGRSGWEQEPAALPAPQPETAGVAEITDFEIRPRQNPANLPGDLRAVVRDGETLTFTARAVHSNGEALHCEMSATRLTDDVEVGGFGRSGPQAMTFDRATREWVSEWTWTPPREDPPRLMSDPLGNTRYLINCVVTDKVGAEIQLSTAAAPVIEKRFGGKFSLAILEASMRGYIALVNDDGSNFRELPGSRDTYSGFFSPDGRFVFDFWSGVRSVDGRLGWPISPQLPSEISWADFSPDGGSLTYVDATAANDFVVYTLATGTKTSVSFPPSSLGFPQGFRCAPNGKIAYTRNPVYPAMSSGTRSVCLTDWDRASNTTGSELAVSPKITNVIHRFELSPAGDRLMVRDGNAVRVYNTDTGALTYSGVTTGYQGDVVWSPQGDRLALYDPSNRAIRIYPASDLSAAPVVLELSHVIPTLSGSPRLHWSL